MVKFRQIVTRTKGEAEKILRRLNDGEDMSELARTCSIAPDTENGGDVGWISGEDLDESMGRVIFSLPVGEKSPIVKTGYGYHIFEVLSELPEGFKSLPEAMTEIKLKLFCKKEAFHYKKWLETLRTLFPVKINQELLRTLELG